VNWKPDLIESAMRSISPSAFFIQSSFQHWFARPALDTEISFIFSRQPACGCLEKF
jgi:hypothetical protein